MTKYFDMLLNVWCGVGGGDGSSGVVSVCTCMHAIMPKDNRQSVK